MPEALGFCTSKDAGSLLGWGLALLAKTEWSGCAVSPLGLFSAASRGARNERGQRVIQRFRGLGEKRKSYHFFSMSFNTVYCVRVYVCVVSTCVHARVEWRWKSVSGLSEWWSSPKSQTVPVQLTPSGHFGSELGNGNKQTTLLKRRGVASVITHSPEHRLHSLG